MLSPPMIVTAMGEKNASQSNVAMPKTVVNAAMVIGRTQIIAASTTASNGVLSFLSSNLTWSNTTIVFLISMPERLRKPSIAIKPNGFPDKSMPQATPMVASGSPKKMISEWRKELNSMTEMKTHCQKSRGEHWTTTCGLPLHALHAHLPIRVCSLQET